MKVKTSINRIDTKLCVKLNSLSGNKLIDRISYIISRLGDGSIYFLVLFLMIFIYQKNFILVFKDYVFAVCINLSFYKLIKKKVKRQRPFDVIEAINKIILPPDEFSFPSGHAAAAAVFTVCTFYHFPAFWGIACLVWMIIVGFSRVYNGVHYPGDVLIGYLMGAIWARLTLYLVYGSSIARLFSPSLT